jgi:hypothetical protein
MPLPRALAKVFPQFKRLALRQLLETLNAKHLAIYKRRRTDIRHARQICWRIQWRFGL